MTVLHNQRTTPLAANASNTAWSDNVTLAYDFTGHDSAHEDGTPWAYSGPVAPVLTKEGSMLPVTLNGEPSRVPSTNSRYVLSDVVNSLGLEFGSGDFTVGIRLQTSSSLPSSTSMQEFKIYGTAGTAFSVFLYEDSAAGWYFGGGVGSSACPLGTAGTIQFFPPNRTIMLWLRRASGVFSAYTQDVTAGANIVPKYQPGAVASAAMDVTTASKLQLSLAYAAGKAGISAFKAWSVAHSDATLNALGLDYWAAESNSAASDGLAISSPTAGATIQASATISGTYTGTAPTSVQVQHGAGSWITGTSATIGAGAWTASFAMTAAASASLRARYGNQTTIVSADVASITIQDKTIALSAPTNLATDACSYRLFQRNGSDQATVRLHGTYAGGTPASLEYQWNGGAWTTLVASPAGGTFAATATLTGPGQGALSVRWSDYPAVTATFDYVGVGDVFIVGGQSNHQGGGALNYVAPLAPSAHPAWKAPEYDMSGTWRENVETSVIPFGKAASAKYSAWPATPGGYGTYFGRFSTLMTEALGVPVAFVACAVGSSSIDSWVVPTTHNNTSVLYGAMLKTAQDIGAHKAVLWWQGEYETSNGTTQATYESKLNAIINTWWADAGTPWVLMNLCATGNGATFSAIHAAIAAVAASNTHVAGIADMNSPTAAFTGSIHYATTAEINTVAARSWAAVQGAFYSKTATIRLVDEDTGVPLANLTGIRWSWSDNPLEGTGAAKTDYGTGETTDASGYLQVPINNSTLSSGGIGRLSYDTSDGTTTQSPSPRGWAGPVAVD